MFDLSKQLEQVRDRVESERNAAGSEANEAAADGQQSSGDGDHESYWVKWPSGTWYERLSDGTYTGNWSH